MKTSDTIFHVLSKITFFNINEQEIDNSRTEMKKCESFDISLDRFSSEYKCCWGSFNVKHGTQIIGMIHATVICFLSLFILRTEADYTRKLNFIPFLMIDIFVLVLLFLGLKKKQSRLLIPYVFYEMLLIVLIFVQIIWNFSIFLRSHTRVSRAIYRKMLEMSNFAFGQQDAVNLQLQLSALFMMLIYIIALIITAWCFSIVYSCYQYFKKLAEFRENGNSIMKCIPWADV
ncbi:hypothetical protein FO519_007624 [Halicephalobus sp. NKZ332]|nr:hypothetical protein FO519_007624 [Halicephalobus sp. NKZ332]